MAVYSYNTSPGMIIRTVCVSNVSVRAKEQDIREFFSFSGDIDHIELQSDTEGCQVAYITFKDPQAVDTALLLSGATIVDQSVNIFPVDDFQQQPEALSQTGLSPSAKESSFAGGAGAAVNKAEDVVTSMLAKGFILGKDAMNKAKSFDEKHQLTANATAKVSSFDKKIGLTEKINMGTSVVNDKVREMDHKFQVSEKTKSAFAAAEQKVNSAGSALMKNKFVFTGASWVTGAFSRVSKAAEDVGKKTKGKIEVGEVQKDNQSSTMRSDVADDFAQVHLSNPSNASEPAAVSFSSAADTVKHSNLP
eukprot:Gb_03078 [translate_table: standard]